MTTMVDSKIGKSFQKSVGRAKEKLLQNLGKVDRTADEILDEHIGNFNKQQGAATRLQKELNNYIRCIRACAAASRSLLESVSEVYEPEWGGKELLSVNSQSVELLWNDFAHRLAEQVLIPLNTYQGQFPEMRKKIEKRSRKLIDFDGERHALQALQANPRRAEAKLAKQRESLEAAKRTYEVLNSELHEELPSLYNSRIVFLVSAMSTLFASEHIFHSETSKVFTELEGIVDRLSKESAKGNLNFKVPSNAIINHTGTDSPKDVKGGNTSPVSPVSKSSSNPSPPESPASPPTSLNIPAATPTTPSDEQAVNSSNKNNKVTEASNTLTSNSNGTISDEPSNNPTKANGSADTPIIASNNTPTPTTTETPTNNIPSSDNSTTTKDKMVNGASSGGGDEVPPESSDKNEPGKVATKNVDENDAMTSDANMPKKTQDDNNNDLVANASSGQNEMKDKKLPMNGHIIDDLTNSDAAALALAKNKTNESTSELKQQQCDIGNNKCNDDMSNGPVATAPSRGISKPLHGILSQSKHANGEISDSPTKEGSGDSKEPGVLYRVRATYRYQKEDVDELSFEAGEIIRVIEYEEPEEQEEGWLMGVKENGEKGLFPANFTRPI